MQTTRRFVRTTVILGASLAIGAAALVCAQGQTSSQSTTASQSGQATASASAKAQASSRSGQFGGSQVGGAPSMNDMNRNVFAAWYTDNRKNRPNQQQDAEVSLHFKYMKGLAVDGSVLADGPFRDGSGLLVILQAADEATAVRMVQGDPVVQSRSFGVVVKPWTIVQGRWIGGGSIGAPTPARGGGVAGAPGGGE